MNLRMKAKHKGKDLQEVRADLEYEKVATSEEDTEGTPQSGPQTPA